jgi:hypothetical protein
MTITFRDWIFENIGIPWSPYGSVWEMYNERIPTDFKISVLSQAIFVGLGIFLMGKIYPFPADSLVSHITLSIGTGIGFFIQKSIGLALSFLRDEPLYWTKK